MATPVFERVDTASENMEQTVSGDAVEDTAVSDDRINTQEERITVRILPSIVPAMRT